MLHITNHFNELKYKFFYFGSTFFFTFFSSYYHASTLAYFYTKPLVNLKFNQGDFLSNYDFIFTSVAEVFSSYMIIALTTTLLVLIPFFMVFFLSFFKTGMYRYEKLYFCYLLVLIFFLALGAIFFVYYCFLPLLLTFFIRFEDISFTNFFTVKLEARLFDYVILVIQTMFLFIFFFQIPIIFLLFLHLKLVNVKVLQRNRRIFLLFFFIFGGIFSPPDVYAQLIIALPLSFCFECLLFFLFLQNAYLNY